mmetsp:Transcript_2217/g.4432  ORF Transcript_2217/g.4432 Transcript_2217/m.4432 type:complete len:229 (+) Transcript_2217:860-1546(+)
MLQRALAVLEVLLPLAHVLAAVVVRVRPLPLHAVVHKHALVLVAVVELEDSLPVPLVVVPLSSVPVAGGVGIGAMAMPAIVLEVAVVTAPVPVRVTALAVHPAVKEGAVELGAVRQKDRGIALELIVLEHPLQPVAIPVQHRSPPVHDVIDPLPHQLLMDPLCVLHNAAAVLLILAPGAVVRVAVLASEDAVPVPSVLLPFSLVDGSIEIVKHPKPVHVIVLELSLVA